jgi:hypothetical protein
MEIIPGLIIDLNTIVSVMIKIAMVLILILSLVMVRQTDLMDKVVDFPVGGGFRFLAWGFCAVSFLLTVIVVLA